MDVYKPVYPGLYYFDTFTFTTLGTSGHRGPDSTKTYANAPWSADQFSIVNGQQQWTVPATGTYHIEAAGAYGAKPGRVVSGDVDLNEGQVVSLLVGQQPTPLTANVVDNVTVGGGGGTFVTVDGKPLIVASGGDGGTSSTQYNLLTTQTFASSSFATISSDGSTTAITDGLYTYIYRNYTPLATLSPGGNSVSLSSDGNKVALSTNDGRIILFNYLNGVWTQTQVASLYGSSSVSSSSDGNVLMAMGQNEVYTYVYSNYLWIPTHINNLYAGDAVSISLSGDGNTGFVSTRWQVYYAKLYSVNRTGTVWSLGTVFSRNFLTEYSIPRCATNFDGTVACYMDAYTGKLYIYTNSNGNWSEYLMDPSQNYFYNYGYGISLSSDGNILSFIGGGSLIIYKYISGTWSLTYTIPQPNNDSNFGTFISMNSATNKIVITGYYNVYTYTQPIPQSGLFLPSGSGSGGSAAGYLTDGQVSNPYFGFLKPQAYVDGGFGNIYAYGAQGEGGFGGGQSPIGLLTLLTSTSGSANVYPSISGINMCMSSDNKTVLVQNLVYRYSNGNWSTPVTLQLYSLLTGSNISRINALSGNGNRAFISQFNTLYVYDYADGSWSVGTLLISNLLSPSVSVTSDGNTVFVCGYEYTGNLGHALIYKYNGSSWSSGAELPWAVQPQNIYASSMSSDGSTAVYASQSQKVDIFKYSGSVWSLSISIPIFATCFGLTTDGNTVIAGTYNNTAYVFKYSGGSWTSVTIVNNDLNDFGKTVDISSDGTFYYIGSTSKLSIYKNGVLFSTINGRINQVKSSGTSILAFSTGYTYIPAYLTGYTDSYNVIFLSTSSLTTTCTATTSTPHGYPYNYKVQITGTNSFDGTWDTVTTSPTTFTFQAFGGSTETSGYVSGTTTGISGGGGYTGSPGDGVSGATCYADPAVRNFTDLGAASNTAGYVTVSLIDPAPPKQTWSWDPTQQWTVTNAVASGLGTPVWSSSLGLFVVSANFQKILTSPDGVLWSVVQSNLPALTNYNGAYGLVASTTGIILAVSADTGYIYRSIDTSNWTLSLSVSISINQNSSIFINNLFILRGNDNTTVYTSPDGITWATITPNIMFSTITYGNSKYVMTAASDYNMYTSVDLATWSQILDSNVTTSTNGWSSVLYDSQTFIALRLPFNSQPSFQTTNNSMSPRPIQMVSNPITNITSLTFTGSWQQSQAKVGDTLTFASISGFLYTISPATYGTVTAVDSGSITISIVSSTITATGSGGYNIYLPFVQNGTTYPVVTSSDGTNWYGRTTPSGNWGILLSGGGSFLAINSYQGTEMYSLDNGVTWKISAGTKGATSGVYSPSLKYFLFTEGNIFYVSLDGSIIIPSTSGGTIGNPLQLVWADTLGIIVAVSAYSIMTSSDGVNWTLVLNLKPNGGSDVTGATVTWSSDLGLLVAYFRNSNTSNSPLLYTSSDGVNWSGTVLAQAFPNVNVSINPCKPCWSPQLGLFTIGKAISRDGLNWTFGSGPNLVCATWSPSLNLFVGDDETNSYYSEDGINWTSSSSYVMYSIAWSPSLGLFVGVGEQTASSSPFLIYTSSNGTSWTQVYSDVSSSAYAWYGSITWSHELNVFVCVYRQVSAINGMRVLISSNGTTWTSPGSNIINDFDGGDLIWSPDLKIFLFTSQRRQAGMLKSLTATKTF